MCAIDVYMSAHTVWTMWALSAAHNVFTICAQCVYKALCVHNVYPMCVRCVPNVCTMCKYCAHNVCTMCQQYTEKGMLSVCVLCKHCDHIVYTLCSTCAHAGSHQGSVKRKLNANTNLQSGCYLVVPLWLVQCWQHYEVSCYRLLCWSHKQTSQTKMWKIKTGHEKIESRRKRNFKIRSSAELSLLINRILFGFYSFGKPNLLYWWGRAA